MTAHSAVTIRLTDVIGFSAAVRWFDTSGMLADVCRGPIGLSDYCSSRGWSQSNVTRVVELLRSAGLVSVHDDCIRPTRALARMNRNLPGGVLSVSRIWEGLDSFVMGEPGVLARSREAHYVDAVEGMRRLYEVRAAELAARLDLPERGLCLDVGAGSGVWSEAVLALNDGWKAIALDLPGVAARCAPHPRRQVSAASADSLPLRTNAVDLVILANLLHTMPPERVLACLAEACRVVRAGCPVVIVDVFGDEILSLDQAVYDLNLGIRGGGLLRRADLLEEATALGLQHVRNLDFGNSRRLLSVIEFRPIV